MKYVIQALIRFPNKKEREEIFKILKKYLIKQFQKDDSFVQLHKCFHDEDESKPCEVEETIFAVEKKEEEKKKKGQKKREKRRREEPRPPYELHIQK
jgi:hypothetical protein